MTEHNNSQDRTPPLEQSASIRGKRPRCCCDSYCVSDLCRNEKEAVKLSRPFLIKHTDSHETSCELFQ